MSPWRATTNRTRVMAVAAPLVVWAVIAILVAPVTGSGPRAKTRVAAVASIQAPPTLAPPVATLTPRRTTHRPPPHRHHRLHTVARHRPRHYTVLPQVTTVVATQTTTAPSVTQTITAPQPVQSQPAPPAPAPSCYPGVPTTC